MSRWTSFTSVTARKSPVPLGENAPHLSLGPAVARASRRTIQEVWTAAQRERARYLISGVIMKSCLLRRLTPASNSGGLVSA